MSTATAVSMTGQEWGLANRQYVLAEMERLRLLLRRHILWLRRNWQRGESGAYAGWAVSDREADMLLSPNSFAERDTFFKCDGEARVISSALAELGAQLSLQKEQMLAGSTPVALDVLTIRFGLTAFEREVLLLCLAPEIDPAFERLYAYVQDDATRKYATPHLALTLFATEESGLERVSFFPGSTLNRWRLAHVEIGSAGTLISCPLRMDGRVVDFLSGINRLDERCYEAVQVAPYAPAPSCHDDLVVRLTQWLRAGVSSSKLLNLVGPPDSGRLALAQALASHAALNVVMLDPQILYMPRQQRAEIIALLEREFVLSDLVFYFDADNLKSEEVQALRVLLGNFNAPVVLASRERFSCEREMLALDVARPNATAQSELWGAVLGESAAALNGELHAVVEQFDFGPRGISRAALLARNHAALRAPGERIVCAEDLWRACRQETNGHLDQLVRKIEPCYNWDDIVVSDEVHRQLREITDQVAHRHRVYQEWGFGKKLNRGRGISALFSGGSGVGKTMAAEVIAHHLKLDLHRVDLAGVVSKYVGETEKNLRCIFDSAERSGAILFFDESESLFGKRFEAKDGQDRFANIETNYLLQRMEDYRGLAILATNMKSALDSAFLRRLRFIVDFPFPDAAQRREIWRKVFPAPAALDALDFNALARLEITGANIRNIALNAAFLAASEGTSIRMEHAVRAARREYTKIDRLIMDSEFGHFAAGRLQ